MDSLAIARTTSLLGLSTTIFLSGVHFSASQLTIPILYRLPTATSTSIFAELYYRGLTTIVPLALLSSLSTGLAAYIDPAKRIWYGVAAGLTVGTLLWTRAVMAGTNETLIALSKDAILREKASPAEVVGLLKNWYWTNMVRSAMDGLGGVVALLALTDLL